MVTEHLYPHLVQEYYVARLRRLVRARQRQRERLQTAADVFALRAEVRRRLGLSFGPLPARTPLAAEVTGRLERPGYTVEKVRFESRPGFPVTANLYVPTTGAPPFPAVLGTCGHSQIGKAEPNYQAFAQGLSARGFMVLLYDPVSQGERLQYPVPEGLAQPQGCCQEHNMMGNQMALLGEFFGLWRVWDGIRALDYLLSRPEVDPRRVGVTGNSGGGTLSTYLNAFDDRFSMAAPSCFVTTYLHNLENELPADSEQIPPRILALGLDMADFFVAQLPRPVLLLGQNNDFFDRRGLEATYAELSRLYGLVGAADKVRLFIGPVDHGYYAQNREAMYGFFCEHAGVAAPAKEGDVHAEPSEALAVTPAGQVLAVAGTRRVFDFTRAAAVELEATRRPVAPARLGARLTRLLALPRRRAAPHYRVLRCRGGDVKPRFAAHSSFAVETEPGIQAILHAFSGAALFHLPRRERVTLGVPHLSTQQDVAAGEFPTTDDLLLGIDVRGMGQSMALTCADASFFAPYGNDYFYASHGLMLGEPYLGRRVHDLLATLDLLARNGYREVHLVGRGLGALTATFAAVLHPLVTQVTLKNALLSCFELTQVGVQSWPASATVFGSLRHLDLPDCYRALAPKAVRILDPWTSQMQPWTDAAALQVHLLARSIPQTMVQVTTPAAP